MLLDGNVLPGLAERIRMKCPSARLSALDRNSLLMKLLADMAALDRGAIGRVYMAVRNHVTPVEAALTESTGLQLHRVIAAAAALNMAGLVGYQPQAAAHQLPELNLQYKVPPAARLTEEQSPVNSPVMKYLRGLAEKG